MRKQDEIWEEPENCRQQIYKSQKGIFLVHASRPSRNPGWFDVVIWLHQHKKGPLNDGRVERVQYYLGPKFFNHIVNKDNAEEDFLLRVTAYGPMLCLARVFIVGETEPIYLQRYCNLDPS